MATGGKMSVSLSQGSEEFFEYCCSPCSKDGIISEAEKQCLDCNEYFCEKCINFHNKLGLTSGHKVVGKKQVGKVASSKPNKPLRTQRCPDHHERITTYCAYHDAICCKTCVSVRHKSFSTSDKCRGICCSAGELFVSCGGGYKEGQGHVAVYSINGARIRTIQTDPSGQQLFSRPLHITASHDGARIYVADCDVGVVSSDRSGKSVSSFTDPTLKRAVVVCTLDNGNVLVCGFGSHNVLQFNRDGLKMGELLKATAGIKYPRSLSYDTNNSRLIVTMDRSNNIKVFDLV